MIPQPCHARRRSASASCASRDAARINRNARSAVVSSSTPGVLHTAMPSSVRRGDVDVVVADRDVRDDAQPPRRTGLEHLAVDPVGEQAHDRVDVRGRGDQLVVRVRVSSARCTSSWPAREWLQPAVGQAAGDEDARPRG